jgi:hypothetical protein
MPDVAKESRDGEAQEESKQTHPPEMLFVIAHFTSRTA